MKLILCAVVLLLFTGCAPLIEDLSRDHRDAPWDPKPGTTLFDQIPNWDNAASRCCGRTFPNCEPWQTPKC